MLHIILLTRELYHRPTPRPGSRNLPQPYKPPSNLLHKPQLHHLIRRNPHTRHLTPRILPKPQKRIQRYTAPNPRTLFNPHLLFAHDVQYLRLVRLLRLG